MGNIDQSVTWKAISCPAATDAAEVRLGVPADSCCAARHHRRRQRALPLAQIGWRAEHHTGLRGAVLRGRGQQGRLVEWSEARQPNAVADDARGVLCARPLNDTEAYYELTPLHN